MTYRSLNSEKVIETAAALHSRIAERFPGSGLSQVAQEVLQVAEETAARSAWMSKPKRWLRVVTLLFVLLVMLGVLAPFFALDISFRVQSITELTQTLESGLNDILLIGAAIFFLVSYENRIKRNRVLEAVHELRSLAHIVDMHQLTKDPKKMCAASSTDSSSARSLSVFELGSYLDYCAELLSIISKISALYAQQTKDPVGLAAVDEIEELTTGLSRKIWQKLVIMNSGLSLEGEHKNQANG